MLTGDIGPVTLPEDLNEATKLTVYLGRQERVYRVPAFVAVCDLLYRRGIAGATALLGVDGTAHGRRQRAAFFSRNAETPMMVVSVGSGEQIAGCCPSWRAVPPPADDHQDRPHLQARRQAHQPPPPGQARASPA